MFHLYGIRKFKTKESEKAPAPDTPPNSNLETANLSQNKSNNPKLQAQIVPQPPKIAPISKKSSQPFKKGKNYLNLINLFNVSKHRKIF